MSCYRVIIRGGPVHQEFSVNQSTNNVYFLVNLAYGGNCKIQQENLLLFFFIFYDVCSVYLPKLLLFSVKIIQVSCFGNYGFLSEVPREGERD